MEEVINSVNEAPETFDELDDYELSDITEEESHGVPFWAKLVVGFIVLLLLFWTVASLVSWN
ncbi:MAG: hypothetical protein ACI83O_000029 [Patescibacteria group bacterium]|jgi:hypothetical protein